MKAKEEEGKIHKNILKALEVRQLRCSRRTGGSATLMLTARVSSPALLLASFSLLFNRKGDWVTFRSLMLVKRRKAGNCFES